MTFESISNELRELYPRGHRDFISLALEEIQLYSKKSHDFAKGGDPHGNFKRVASWMQLYPNIDWATSVGVALLYKMKQFDAAMWQISEGFEGKTEGVDKRLEDDSVYDKIIRILRKE